MSINTNAGMEVPDADACPGQWNPSACLFPGGHVHDLGSTDDDDDGLEPTQPPLDGDVSVEVLPEQSGQRLKRPRSYHRASSFSSTSPSETDYESDVTFRIPSRPTPPVHATSVEDPPDTPVAASHSQSSPLQRTHRDGHHDGGVHVEMLDTPSKRKQNSISDESAPRKRRREGMDIDMDGLPEGSYGPGWYEPEKDRIIITSLSSPESSPPPPDRRRSMSPDSERRQYSYAENRHLSQPGSQGFTISPSLLTHILNAQRDQFNHTPEYPSQERGLVLYRPLGITPDPVVQQWNQNDNVPLGNDSDRFEEVDSDEDLTTGNNNDTMMGMDTEETGWEGGDEAMDIE